MRCRFALLLLVLVAVWPAATSAHEVRPAYLQLHQTGADTYDVLWKVPAVGDAMRLSLYVEFPQTCSNLKPPHGFFADNAYTEQWSVKCQGGLAGSTVRIEGLTATLTDVLVRVERLDGSSQVTRVMSSLPSFVVESMPRPFEVVRTYLVLGIEHILTGVDHLLFVSGLLLLVNGIRRLLLTVSAFTLSHTVTLTLATLGFVHAYEVLRKKENPSGVAQRKPWLVAFSFGLLHGLGFAGGLSAAGLPAGHIPLALGFFSAGVEIGHFSFVGAATLVIVAFRNRVSQLPSWSWQIAPYAIGSFACYWLIARLAAF
jgi:hypothetical protein